MSERPDIHRLIDLHKLTLAFQSIERAVCYVEKNTDRPENDAEHSYTLAMTAWFLASSFPELDRDKLIRYALAHDLIEVYSGDTSVFADAATLASKDKREEAGLNRLVKEWPDFLELTDAMRAYKQKSDDEAKFVYALDKIMPVILNYIYEGYSWQKHHITFDQLHNTKKDKFHAAPKVGDYYQQLYKLLLKNPHFFHHSSSQQR
ncbi:MAG TPA: HD domain-containing protein [Candidatus Saccharimonadales bacterium]|nr:HD domain-containing protein [Candidatus Saccharimonadales bacterium]